jgi:hypothetical protein
MEEAESHDALRGHETGRLKLGAMLIGHGLVTREQIEATPARPPRAGSRVGFSSLKAG